MHRLDEDSFMVDPSTLFINGHFNWNLMDDLINGKTDDLKTIGANMPENTSMEVILSCWEDGGDDGSWIDYDVESVHPERYMPIS